MDIHTSFEFLFSLKALSALSSTGYGPVYVGVSGDRWLSILSYTKGHFDS